MLYACVTVPTTSFGHLSFSQAQSTDGNSLQSAASAQALNSSLLPPPTCTISTSSHPAQSSHNHALTSVADPSVTELIKAEEASEAFRECRADLLEAIVDPLILANHFYSKKIISRETLKQITELSLTVSNKNVILLNAVEARIRTHPSDFLILLAILENDVHLCICAEGLRNCYCEYPI